MSRVRGGAHCLNAAQSIVMFKMDCFRRVMSFRTKTVKVPGGPGADWAAPAARKNLTKEEEEGRMSPPQSCWVCFLAPSSCRTLAGTCSRLVSCLAACCCSSGCWVSHSDGCFRQRLCGTAFGRFGELSFHSSLRRRLFDDGGSVCLSSQVTADRCAQEYNGVSDLNVAQLTNSGGYKG